MRAVMVPRRCVACSGALRYAAAAVCGGQRCTVRRQCGGTRRRRGAICGIAACSNARRHAAVVRWLIRSSRVVDKAVCSDVSCEL